MDIYSLEQILAANLSWNRARIKFLSPFFDSVVSSSNS